MELDELKNTWTVLDEQLKKNEMLNKRIIQEMLYKKSSKSLSWLMNTEFFSVIVALLSLPLCIWIFNYNNHFFIRTISSKILVIIGIATCIIGLIWQSYKILKYLIKIDFSKIIKNNMQWINKYAILIKYEKIIGYFVVIPLFSLFGILSYYELKVNFLSWIYLTALLLVAVILSYWSYKKIYDSNIQSIKKSLEELEELKD